MVQSTDWGGIYLVWRWL